jgi:hypothetical protein
MTSTTRAKTGQSTGSSTITKKVEQPPAGIEGKRATSKKEGIEENIRNQEKAVKVPLPPTSLKATTKDGAGRPSIVRYLFVSFSHSRLTFHTLSRHAQPSRQICRHEKRSSTHRPIHRVAKQPLQTSRNPLTLHWMRSHEEKQFHPNAPKNEQNP